MLLCQSLDYMSRSYLFEDEFNRLIKRRCARMVRIKIDHYHGKRKKISTRWPEADNAKEIDKRNDMKDDRSKAMGQQ